MNRQIAFAVLLMGFQISPCSHARTLEELEARVEKLFEERCSSCHGPKQLRKGKYIKRPGGRFETVLDLDALSKNTELVIAGQPNASVLYEQVLSDEMPENDDRLSPAEKTLVKDWILELGGENNLSADKSNVLAVPMKPLREFITARQVEETIEADLQAQSQLTRKFMRYFTLTNLWNAGSEAIELDIYRQGLFKLVNSLSWSRQLVAPESIDKYGTIYRIDLRDFDWDASHWELITKNYPYAFVGSGNVNDTINDYTGSELAFIRGDWFAFQASQPPIYHELLGLPASLQALEELLDIDIKKNIENYTVARAGFTDSGVSSHNRLIERHEIANGAFWISYDFGSSSGRSDLKTRPLGPKSYLGRGFEHDGGEVIFNLPNGLQAYFLVKADGGRIDTGPTNIVYDSSGRFNRVEIVNGISCMACHNKGIIPKSDQLLEQALNDPKISSSDMAQVERIYPSNEEMRALFEQDKRRFQDSLLRLGVDVQAEDPVALLYARFEKKVSYAQAPSEMGITPLRFERIKKRLPGLYQQLSTSGVPRDKFVAEFNRLAVEFGLTQVNSAEAASSSPRFVRRFHVRNKLESGWSALIDFKGRIEAGDQGTALFTIENGRLLHQAGKKQEFYRDLRVGLCYYTDIETDGGKNVNIFLPPKDSKVDIGTNYRHGYSIKYVGHDLGIGDSVDLAGMEIPMVLPKSDPDLLNHWMCAALNSRSGGFVYADSQLETGSE